MTKNLKTPKSNSRISEPSPETAKLQTTAPTVKAQSTARPAHLARVSLQFINPAAKQVCVAGSFNEWKPETMPLTHSGNGQWSGDVAIKPGRHEYLFVVDGQWIPDPKAKETVPNPFGGRNSVLVVS